MWHVAGMERGGYAETAGQPWTGEPRKIGSDSRETAPYSHAGRAAELAYAWGVGGGGQRHRGAHPHQGTDGLWRFPRRGPTHSDLGHCAVAPDVWRVCGWCTPVYFDHRDYGGGDEKPTL